MGYSLCSVHNFKIMKEKGVRMECFLKSMETKEW